MNECHMNKIYLVQYSRRVFSREICTVSFLLYCDNAPSFTVQEKYLLYIKA